MLVLNTISFMPGPILRSSLVPLRPTLAAPASAFDRHRSSNWNLFSRRPLGPWQLPYTQPILHSAAADPVHAREQRLRGPCAGWQRYETASD
jgi:hypothetical protein